MSQPSAVRVRSARRRSQRPALKASGGVSQLVQAVGAENFGIVSVDCAKLRSRWMLCDFFGDTLLPPATVEHTGPGFRQAIETLRVVVARRQLAHVLVAIERTGNYHRPVQRAFRDAGYETRIVHPFAARQFRQVEHPGDKTDDHDLFGIHRAAVVGFGLIDTPLDETFLHLRALVRHRRDLVRKVSAVQQQIREHLHATLPGFAGLFADDKFWDAPVAMPLARRCPSPDAVRQLGAAGIVQWLRAADIRFQQRTIDKIIGWSEQAAAAETDALVRQRILCDLDDDRIAKRTAISRVELEIAVLLARTPYVLLLAIPGINVVSAGDLAGEAGPIAHYANPNALTGRAGLFPSRYQSDQVDVTGRMVRCANRRLRAALLLIADNLLLVNNYFRAQGALWKQQRVDPRLQRVRIAKRFSRLAFLMLAGRQIVPHACCREPHYILDKLLAFHLEHGASPAQIRDHLAAAAAQLPQAARPREAAALEQSATRFAAARKPQLQSLGTLLKEVLTNRLQLTVQSSPEV
jgi:transposase